MYILLANNAKHIRLQFISVITGGHLRMDAERYLLTFSLQLVAYVYKYCSNSNPGFLRLHRNHEGLNTECDK